MRLSETQTPASPDPPTPVSRFSLRFATLGGGVAWLAHLVLAYGLAEFGCVSGLGRVQWAGLSVVAWLLLAMSLLTIGLALAATWVAWRNRRRLLLAWGERSESHEAEDFTSRLALITDAIFVGIIAVQSVPIFYFWREC